MAKAANDRLQELKKALDGLFGILMINQNVLSNNLAARGPSTLSSWVSWSSPTVEQQVNQAVQDELRGILIANPVINYKIKKGH
jgi:hypothetical protein